MNPNAGQIPHTDMTASETYRTADVLVCSPSSPERRLDILEAAVDEQDLIATP